jgi:hypothetical protein
MASKKDTGDRQLHKLEQRFDVWQVDAREVDTGLEVEGRIIRPWLALVGSLTDDLVLEFEMLHEKPGPAQLWPMMRKAMLAPADGTAHRPTAVQVGSADLADGLRSHLEPLGITCETVPALEFVDAVVDELIAQIPMFRSAHQPGLLEMPGVTPASVASLFDAAALFYEQTPWKKVGERPIRVTCERFDSGPWFAVMLGQGGMSSGLVLYDDLDQLREIQSGALSEEENARRTSALSLIYGTQEDLIPDDLDAARQHGWRVAGADAYPVIYRMEPGLSIRAPLAWELQLLEGCLRGLPEFVRKKTRRLEPMSITLPTEGGDLPLELSWEG